MMDSVSSKASTDHREVRRVVPIAMDAAPAAFCQVVTETGGEAEALRLLAGETIESRGSTGECVWSASDPGNSRDSRFHVRNCELPAGWYEFTISIDCLDGAMELPTFHHGHNESHRVILPAPDKDGRISALLLFRSPLQSFGFSPSIVPATFRMHDMCLRRLPRSSALRFMLAGVNQQVSAGRWLKRLARFVSHVRKAGLSDATTMLYKDYLLRLQAKSLAAPRSAVMAPEDEAAESVGSRTTAEDANHVLAPYLIDQELDQSSVVAVADNARRLEREGRLIAECGLFDEHYYLRHNADVAKSGMDPRLHFCKYGWRNLRNPNPDFDVWWYWANHLDPGLEQVNPLVHYALLGREAGLSTQPPRQPGLRRGHAFAEGRSARRICLFAGYDPDGIVDDCVVAYVRELSRHADVYYLSDGDMRPGELDKLGGIVKDAWAIRHGAYDFGSWSKLARDLVGWDTIESYDELLFVNDSGYLLRSLDDVFSRMAAKQCDWWGLQATKGIHRTQDKRSNQFRDPVPMSTVKDELLGTFEQEYFYDFHVGSYFLAFRQPVVKDSRFRALIDGVTAQSRKLNIVRKYEIGITRHLIGYGYAFDTYVDRLLPFHPIYSESAFDLIREGFPLFKRYLLVENLYDVPGLSRWKERIRDLVADAPVKVMERNLLRVSSPERLHGSLHLERARGGTWRRQALLSGKEFAEADAKCAKHDDWWAFPVCAFTDTFSGNERAVFEGVKNDSSIRKIVLTGARRVEVDGENVEVVPLRSREGQDLLMRSRQMFIKHSPSRNLVYPVLPKQHNIINLWHGIPLKRIGYASLDMSNKLRALAHQHAKCRAVISSSRIDTMAMASGFYPLTYHQVWMTGLPRNDFILRDFDALPLDFREQAQRLRSTLDGKRLVLFMPTFKQAQSDGYYVFSDGELASLRQWLDDNNAVLGVREHMADQAHAYFSMLSEIGAINLCGAWYPNAEVLYREAELLITDYSSSFIDFMLTGKPMISFAYDYEAYANEERGLFYNMDEVFPGPVCRDFAGLMRALGNVFEPLDDMATAQYEWKRRLFFEYIDDNNAERVIERVKGLYESGGRG